MFLESVKAALTADNAWDGGWYRPKLTRSVRAMARVYAGWQPSQAFQMEEVYLDTGYSSLEDYLVSGWEGRFLEIDANDLLVMLSTWQNGDISHNPYGREIVTHLRCLALAGVGRALYGVLQPVPSDGGVEVRLGPLPAHYRIGEPALELGYVERLLLARTGRAAGFQRPGQEANALGGELLERGLHRLQVLFSAHGESQREQRPEQHFKAPAPRYTLIHG